MRPVLYFHTCSIVQGTFVSALSRIYFFIGFEKLSAILCMIDVVWYQAIAQGTEPAHPKIEPTAPPISVQVALTPLSTIRLAKLLDTGFA